MFRSTRRARAFTLIEIVVTVAVLGALALLSVLGVSALRERAAQEAAKANLDVVSSALSTFATTSPGGLVTRDVAEREIATVAAATVAQGLPAQPQASEGQVWVGWVDQSPAEGQWASGFDFNDGVGNDAGGTRVAVVAAAGGKLYGQVTSLLEGMGSPPQEYPAGTTPQDLLIGSAGEAGGDPLTLAAPVVQITLDYTTGAWVATWDRPDGADGDFIVETTIDESVTMVTQSDPTTTGTAAYGQRVAVRVQATETSIPGRSAWSNVAEAARGPQTPDAPVVVIDTTSGVWTGAWLPAEAATGYVARYNVDGGPWVSHQVVEGEDLVLTGSVGFGQVVTMEVKATRDALESPWSLPGSQTRLLPTPGTPTPTIDHDTGVWSASWLGVVGASGYLVEHRVAGGPWQQTAVTLPEFGAVAGWGQLVELRVQATADGVTSAWSGTGSITRRPATPAAPAVVHQPIGKSWVATWDPAEGATGYVVEYTIDAGDAGEPLTTALTTASKTPFVAGETVTVRVKATLGSLESGWSPPASVLAEVGAPQAPTVTVVGATWRATWAPVEDARQYVVEYRHSVTDPWVALAPQTTMQASGPLGYNQWVWVRVRAEAGPSISEFSPTAQVRRGPATPNPTLTGEVAGLPRWTALWAPPVGTVAHEARVRLTTGTVSGDWEPVSVQANESVAQATGFVVWGAKVEFQARSTNGDTWSGWSTVDVYQFAPDAPTITVQNREPNSFQIVVEGRGAWSYDVAYRKVGTTSWQGVTPAGPTDAQMPLTITDLDPGTSYEVRARSRAGTKVSGYTTITTSTTLGAPGVTIAEASPGVALLDWTAAPSEDATSYEVTLAWPGYTDTKVVTGTTLTHGAPMGSKFQVTVLPRKGTTPGQAFDEPLSIPRWSHITMSPGWIDYPTAGPADARFTRTSAGVVYLTGLYQPTSAASLRTGAATVGVLPVGFRPSRTVWSTAAVQGGSLYSAASIPVSINKDGQIQVHGSAHPTRDGIRAWGTFGGISFLAATGSDGPDWETISTPGFRTQTTVTPTSAWTAKQTLIAEVDRLGRAHVNGVLRYSGSSNSTPPPSGSGPILPSVPSPYFLTGVSLGLPEPYGYPGMRFPSTYDGATTGVHTWGSMLLQDGMLVLENPTQAMRETTHRPITLFYQSTPAVWETITPFAEWVGQIQATIGSDNLVILRGVVELEVPTVGKPLTNGVPGHVIATLPAQYRPSERQTFMAATSDGQIRFDVGTDGRIGISAAALTGKFRTDLSNLRWVADGAD